MGKNEMVKLLAPNGFVVEVARASVERLVARGYKRIVRDKPVDDKPED